MKIRTDFVTNSSSSSFIAISFKGETIARILEKHRPFIEEIEEAFQDIFCNPTFSIDDESNVTLRLEHSQDCDFVAYVPKTKNEIVSTLCDLFGYIVFELFSNFDEDMYDELVDELRENESDLLETTERVDWTASDFFYGEFLSEGDEDEAEQTASFEFSIEEGERYTFSNEKEGVNCCEDDED